MKRWLLGLLLVGLTFSGSSMGRGGGGFSSGSRSSFSSSSRSSFSSGSRSSSSSSRSFSSGSSKSSSKSSSSYDAKATRSAKVDSNRSSFTYSRPAVSTMQVTHQSTFYSSYRSNPRYVEVVHHYHYNEGISPWFWIWMMDRPHNDQAYWIYNHRSEIDDAHYREMLAQNAALADRVHQLETQNTPRDPNYQPPGVDRDIVYKTDEDIRRDHENDGWSSGQWEQFVGRVISGLLLLVLIWALFFKRWSL